MAVDTPILERRTVREERNNIYLRNQADVEAEEAHNARIRDNYAKLINPNYSIDEVFTNAEKPAEEIQSEVIEASVRTNQEPYLVRNARADSEIFRADSAINKRLESSAQISIADVKDDEEEENEDLRPTPATIQYRTIDRERTADSAKSISVETVNKSSKLSLTRNQKIALIVAAAVIVSLIVLIIVNSAVIAGLNSDIGDMNTEIEEISEKIMNVKTEMLTLKGAYAGVSDNLFYMISDIINY